MLTGLFCDIDDFLRYCAGNLNASPALKRLAIEGFTRRFYYSVVQSVMRLQSLEKTMGIML